MTTISIRLKPPIFKAAAWCVSLTVLFMAVFPNPTFAQVIAGVNLPVPGAMVSPSPAFVPVMLKGLTLNADDPFGFKFIIDTGHTTFSENEVREESQRLVKYFMTSLTVPSRDLWVNLSPYENDRVIPDALAQTDMGRELLAQDYMLKQLTASLMYPEHQTGQAFWSRVRALFQKETGDAASFSADTFHKVWIMPESATVFENYGSVYIINSRLKVMLEEDYYALKESAREQAKDMMPGVSAGRDGGDAGHAQAMREVILPLIEKEVNEGETFAPLRQIYHALILARWYKETVTNGLIAKSYADQSKVKGLETDDPAFKEQIYGRYMAAYKKGVYDYIKEEYDPQKQTVIPRHYFSGGVVADVPIKNILGDSAEVEGKVGEAYVMDIKSVSLPGLTVKAGSVAANNDQKIDEAMLGREVLAFLNAGSLTDLNTTLDALRGYKNTATKQLLDERDPGKQKEALDALAVLTDPETMNQKVLASLEGELKKWAVSPIEKSRFLTRTLPETLRELSFRFSGIHVSPVDANRMMHDPIFQTQLGGFLLLGTIQKIQDPQKTPQSMLNRAQRSFISLPSFERRISKNGNLSLASAIRAEFYNTQVIKDLEKFLLRINDDGDQNAARQAKRLLTDLIIRNLEDHNGKVVQSAIASAKAVTEKSDDRLYDLQNVSEEGLFARARAIHGQLQSQRSDAIQAQIADSGTDLATSDRIKYSQTRPQDKTEKDVLLIQAELKDSLEILKNSSESADGLMGAAKRLTDLALDESQAVYLARDSITYSDLPVRSKVAAWRLSGIGILSSVLGLSLFATNILQRLGIISSLPATGATLAFTAVVVAAANMFFYIRYADPRVNYIIDQHNTLNSLLTKAYSEEPYAGTLATRTKIRALLEKFLPSVNNKNNRVWDVLNRMEDGKILDALISASKNSALSQEQQAELQKNIAAVIASNLTSPMETVRVKAAELFAEWGDFKDIGLLLDVSRNDPSADVKSAANIVLTELLKSEKAQLKVQVGDETSSDLQDPKAFDITDHSNLDAAMLVNLKQKVSVFLRSGKFSVNTETPLFKNLEKIYDGLINEKNTEEANHVLITAAKYSVLKLLVDHELEQDKRHMRNFNFFGLFALFITVPLYINFGLWGMTSLSLNASAFGFITAYIIGWLSKNLDRDIRKFENKGEDFSLEEWKTFISEITNNLQWLMEPSTVMPFLWQNQDLADLWAKTDKITTITMEKSKNALDQLTNRTDDTSEFQDDSKKGGIDMIDIELKRQAGGEGRGFQFTPAALEALPQDTVIESLSPVIIYMAPVTNVLPLLGVRDTEDDDAGAVKVSRLAPDGAAAVESQRREAKATGVVKARMWSVSRGSHDADRPFEPWSSMLLSALPEAVRRFWIDAA